MPVDAEKEITKLYRALHSAQDEIGKTFYRWRQVAVEFAGTVTFQSKFPISIFQLLTIFP